MNIIRIMGGLGNQMFQYALYRKFLYLGQQVKIDTHLFNKILFHNGYELDKVFNIQPNIASPEEIGVIADIGGGIIGKAKRRFRFYKKSHFKPTHEQVAAYMPEVFCMSHTYLDGYWQSEKYFQDIRDIIRKEFTFKFDLINKNAAIAHEMKACESVGIHIRRGDYMNTPLFQGICTIEYYNMAIDHIKKTIGEPSFYVFSDDMSWCKSNLNIYKAEFVDWNKGLNSYLDMQLMSNCKHNIIANSSFSWWGAWLNNNPSKIVVSPSKWFNDNSIYQEDIIPKEWLRLSV